MLKNLQLLCGFIITGIIATGISSCKEDEPPTPPRISLASVEPLQVNESVGIFEIEVHLDKAYSKDISIEYTLSGTAVDLASAASPAKADYQINRGSGEVDIDAGETTGVIEFQVFNDAAFEQDETIIVHLDEVEDEPSLEITNDDEVTITITNDDQKIVASVATASITTNESDGVDENGELSPVLVTVSLDNPAPENIVIEYQLAGTALDSVTGSEEQIPGSYWDYYINGVSGELSIASGQSTGVIEIQVYTDFNYEDTETIEVTLVATEAVEVSTNNKTTVNVEQQDGKGIQLDWTEHDGDADMDLFLFGLDENDVPVTIVAISASPGNTPPFELIFIPDLFTEGRLGLGCVYYSGTADPLNFTVEFVDVTDGVPEEEATRDVYSATYTAANKNEWDEEHGTYPPAVVQTFSIDGGIFTDISEISVPASGSRSRTAKLKPVEPAKGFVVAPSLKRSNEPGKKKLR